VAQPTPALQGCLVLGGAAQTTHRLAVGGCDNVASDDPAQPSSGGQQTRLGCRPVRGDALQQRPRLHPQLLGNCLGGHLRASTHGSSSPACGCQQQPSVWLPGSNLPSVLGQHTSQCSHHLRAAPQGGGLTCTPRLGRTTLPPAISCGTTRFTVSIGMAKPTPALTPGGARQGSMGLGRLWQAQHGDGCCVAGSSGAGLPKMPECTSALPQRGLLPQNGTRAVRNYLCW